MTALSGAHLEPHPLFSFVRYNDQTQTLPTFQTQEVGTWLLSGVAPTRAIIAATITGITRNRAARASERMIHLRHSVVELIQSSVASVRVLPVRTRAQSDFCLT